MSSHSARRPRVAARRVPLAMTVLPFLLTACGGPGGTGDTSAGTPAPTTPATSATSASSSSATTAAATTTSATTDTSSPSGTSATSGPSTKTCTFDGALTAPGDTTLSRMTVTKVRAGRQDCFDRLVFDLSGDPAKKPGYQVRYVPQVQQQGSGKPVALRGGAFLSITVWAPAYDASGQATYIPADRNELADVSGYSSFRQIAFAGSFEGGTTVGLGVREQLPFKVQVLDDGGQMRLVDDVAHEPA